jgi:hypothetical protein
LFCLQGLPADLPPSATLADKIIALRTDGHSIPGIAKKLKLPPREVHAVVGEWSAGYFGPNWRGDMLAIVTHRLERLFAAHREKAYRGDPQATQLCLKALAHLCSVHGLYQPSIAVANSTNMVIDARPTATDRIEKAINALIEDQRRQEAARAVEAEAAPAETTTAVNGG